MTRAAWRAPVAVAALVAAASGAPGGATAASNGPVWLLTEGEAALAPAPLPRAAVELPKNGPVITLVTPSEAAEVTPPFPVEVRFAPRPGGAPVRMDTLRLTVLKVFEIDITERVRPYILERETKLFVKEARIPPGHHRLKLLIADADGRQSGEILELTVR